MDRNYKGFFQAICTLEIILGLNPRRATQVKAFPEFPPP